MLINMIGVFTFLLISYSVIFNVFGLRRIFGIPVVPLHYIVRFIADIAVLTLSTTALVYSVILYTNEKAEAHENGTDIDTVATACVAMESFCFALDLLFLATTAKDYIEARGTEAASEGGYDTSGIRDHQN